MVPRRAATLAVIMLLLAGAGAAQGSVEGDLKALQINGTAPVNITLENPLPVNDRYTVTFSGDGFLLVQPEYPPVGGNITESGGGKISVDMGPNAEFNMSVVMEGTAIGQGLLVATVNSSTTQLSSEDEIAVRVEPNFAPVTVSAPGIMGSQLLVIAILGAAAAGLLARREDFKASGAHPAV